MTRAVRDLPHDVELFLRDYLQHEGSWLARLHLRATLENVEIARKEGRFTCGDTGYPVFYIFIGNNAQIEGGIGALSEIAREAVSRATKQFKLRPNMVHPLSRKNPGLNVGPHMPQVEIKFADIDGVEVIAVPKGGGAEVFGSFFRMLMPGDGLQGVIRFVLDSVCEGTYSGKTCPPNIIGVGIGGTADLCMKLAKEAAVLRPIGYRNPDKKIAELELRLIEAINSLGIGPMGTRGKCTAMDVHVEYAFTHTAALPVAVSIQCAMARRASAKLGEDGVIEYSDCPQLSHRSMLVEQQCRIH